MNAARLTVVLGALLTVGAQAALPATLNVPAEYATVQAAVDAASAGDTVLVQPGTYPGTIDFKGKAITVRGTDPDDPAVVAATIIDGYKLGAVVRFVTGEQADSVLAGLTITRGHRSGVYCYMSAPTLLSNRIVNNRSFLGYSAQGWGGGVDCYDSEPTLIGNTISGNTADAWGGGIACREYGAPATSPLLKDNIITGNTATQGGGVFLIHCSRARLQGNTISDNFADEAGGGVCCLGANATLTGNTIADNISTIGAGVCCRGGAPVLQGNSITGNQGGNYGGGVLCNRSAATLKDNTIAHNRADRGGGVSCYSCAPALTANAILHNEAGIGGGIYCYSASPTVMSATIAGNSADRGGGLASGTDASATLRNTIVAFNSGGGLWCASSSRLPVVTYCNLYGNTLGNYLGCPKQSGVDGNLCRDPLFANLVGDNVRLKSRGGRWNGTLWVIDALTSPCIDTGDPALPFAEEPFPNGGRANMGYDSNTAYASRSDRAAPTPPATVAIDPDSPCDNDTLTATAEGSTGGGTLPLIYHYQWARRPSEGGDWGAWGHPGRRLDRSLTTPGEQWKARARASHGALYGRWTESLPVTIGGTPPVAPALVSVVPASAGRGTVAVTVQLASPAAVQVWFENLAGRTVAVLPSLEQPGGATTLLWNGRSATGTPVPPGTYLVRVTARGRDGACRQVVARVDVRR